MSARRPTLFPEVPPFSTPTTPVFPIPRCTSTPNDSSRAATSSEVRFSWKPSSGCAWMSRRHSRISSCNFSGMNIFREPVVRQFCADLHLPSLVEHRGAGGGELQAGADVVGEARDLRLLAPSRRLAGEEIAEVGVAVRRIFPPAAIVLLP